MKRLLPSLFLATCLAIPLAHAEKADSTKPTNVEANKMEYDDVKQINTFTGNVVLTRGTIRMTSARMIVRQDPEGYQFVTMYAPPNGLATFRQRRDGGNDQWIEGKAERIEYDDKTEIMKLFVRAEMRRLENGKSTDEVQGEYISYDTRAEFFTVHNSPSGTSKDGGGRIRAVIQPRTTAPAGGN
ncbi:lipopolysaccharide transport periplasmic protein LptA [uncultured Oxalicibacterium sp.]|uniref:lipopolysaccharide transport periplasmic protein LptA n=1 Tax=uncultured Oxalicibacterium sp. TaxID=1168540 RepID=UPI0025E5654E|nr:lipopolysaccharide transport periplasmic protein LptA [uncultured Oxalicibacterium sp.]